MPEDPQSAESVALLRGCGNVRWILDLGDGADPWFEGARSALREAFPRAQILRAGGDASQPAYCAVVEAVVSGASQLCFPFHLDGRPVALQRAFHPGRTASELFVECLRAALSKVRTGVLLECRASSDEAGPATGLDLRFDPALTASALERRVRADARPLGKGLTARCGALDVVIHRARFALWPGRGAQVAGSLHSDGERLLLCCGSDALELCDLEVYGLRMAGVRLAEQLGWGSRTRFSCEAPESGAGDFIPFGVPAIGRAERLAVDQTLASRWIGTGPEVARFEAEFADAVGASHAVAVSSCTAALHLALLTHGIGPGDEVITTPMSFVATANAVLYSGAEPVFADIDDGTLNLDPSAVAEQITSRTRAILAVHFGGAPCDIAALRGLAKRHDLALIEDAAHAVGSRFGDGRRVGSSGNDTCFSFYPNKNITTCEGGMLTTEDATRAERLRSLRLHGLSTDAWKRFGSRALVRSRMHALGFKYNMTDLQAALGRAQLTRLEAFTELRNRQARRYRAAFADCQHFAALPALSAGRSAYHLFTLWVRGLVRDEVIEELRRAGVGASIHYHPIHLQPYYRERDPTLAGRFPAAERAGAQTLSLPIGPCVRAADQERIIRAVQEIDRRHRVARLRSAGRVRAAQNRPSASVREVSEPGP
jgi:dTDP-4-amino-4,6-dideoxygalactose transaminase